MLTKRPLVSSLALLVLALSGCSTGQSAPAPSTNEPLPATGQPSVPPTSPPTADPKQADVFSLKVGDCLNDLSSMLVSEVPQVDCAAPHDLEVFDEFSVNDPTWDPVALGKEADSGCTERFAAFIGVAYDASTLDVTSYKPTATSWATGDRLISCTVGDSSAKTTGSLRGAAR